MYNLFYWLEPCINGQGFWLIRNYEIIDFWDGDPKESNDILQKGNEGKGV